MCFCKTFIVNKATVSRSISNAFLTAKNIINLQINWGELIVGHLFQKNTFYLKRSFTLFEKHWNSMKGNKQDAIYEKKYPFFWRKIFNWSPLTFLHLHTSVIGNNYSESITPASYSNCNAFRYMFSIALFGLPNPISIALVQFSRDTVTISRTFVSHYNGNSSYPIFLANIDLLLKFLKKSIFSDSPIFLNCLKLSLFFHLVWNGSAFIPNLMFSFNLLFAHINTNVIQYFISCFTT